MPLSDPALPRLHQYKGFGVVRGAGRGSVWPRPGKEEGKSGPKLRAFLVTILFFPFFFLSTEALKKPSGFGHKT